MANSQDKVLGMINNPVYLGTSAESSTDTATSKTNPYITPATTENEGRSFKARVTINSLLCFVAFPLIFLVMGIIADAVVNRKPFKFNAPYSVASSYIASPFLFILSMWPRSRSQPKLARNSRVVFDIFMALLVLCTVSVNVSKLATSDPQSLFFYQRFVNNVLNPKNGPTFEDVNDMESFWDYTLDTFCPALFPDKDTPTTGFGIPTGVEGISVAGVPVLRQARIKSVNNMGYGFDHLRSDLNFYPSYKEGTVDKKLYGPFKETLENNSLYTLDDYLKKVRSETPEEILNNTYHGYNFPDIPPFHNFTTIQLQLPFYYQDGQVKNVAGKMVKPIHIGGPDLNTVYEPGGYFLFPLQNYYSIGNKSIMCKEYMQWFKDNNWIDRQTRLIEINLVAMAENINKWGNVIMVFQFTPVGLVLKNYDFSVGNLNEEVINYSSGDMNSIGSWRVYYLLSYPYVVYFFCGLFLRRRERGSIVQVFTRDFVAFDFIPALLVWLGWYANLGAAYSWPSQDQGSCAIFPQQCAFSLSGSTGYWMSNRNFLGVALIFLWLRLLPFIALIPGIGLIPKAMLRALGMVGLFSVSLVIVLAGFIAGFLTIFSAVQEQFHGILPSLLTLWSALLGNIDIQQFINSNYILGTFMFIFFSFIVLFTFLTFMISLITSAYESEKDDEEKFFEENPLSEEMPRWKRMRYYMWAHFHHRVDKED
eukprot:m.23539 g.23539  ORF g.23539 m.23539 type:complete len:705 (+) comp7512_c0_seq1:259-2373(+)